jgi:hypothetical protein
MRWLLFSASLFANWVAFNLLFMVPGRYTSTKAGIVAALIGLAVGTAWLSARRFIDTRLKRQNLAALWQTPPLLLCTFILVVMCAIGLIQFVW